LLRAQPAPREENEGEAGSLHASSHAVRNVGLSSVRLFGEGANGRVEAEA
jgi:hypothetical protein